MNFPSMVRAALALILFIATSAASLAANVADFLNFSTPAVPGRLYVPPEAASQSRPLILFLHGSGETGNNNTAQINANIDNLLAGAKARGAFLYAAQATTFTWADSTRTTNVMAQIDQAITQFNVDPQRLYVTGLSMGGGGVWNMLNRFHDRFAAGVPIAAVSPSFDFDGSNFVGKPVWAFHARNDAAVSPVAGEQVVNAILQSAAASPLTFPSFRDSATTVRYVNDDVGLNYTEWPQGGHGIWGPVFNLPEMYDWLFGKQLSMAPPVDPAPNGQVVVSNSSPFLPIGDSAGLAIPADAGFVAVGSFSLPDDEIEQTTAATLGVLASSFTQFGPSHPMGVNGVEGLFAVSIGAPLDDDHPLLGQPLYLVAGSGPDIAASDSLVVFKSSQQFPASVASPFFTSLGLSAALSSGEILLGTQGSVFANRLGGFRAGIIAAAVGIPEPAAAMLIAIALAPALRYRVAANTTQRPQSG